MSDKIIILNLDKIDPYNPLGLPPNTIRLQLEKGVEPNFENVFIDSTTLVDIIYNIWDIHFTGHNMNNMFENGKILKILGANTKDVVEMRYTFGHCTNLTVVALFDTSSVTDMHGLFFGCDSLVDHIPQFDTSNVTDMQFMFYKCISLEKLPHFNTSKVTAVDSMFAKDINVKSGALELYNQMSTQANPPTSHNSTFTDCGRDTTTGAAELAQIPSTWGGTA